MIKMKNQIRWARIQFATMVLVSAGISLAHAQGPSPRGTLSDPEDRFVYRNAPTGEAFSRGDLGVLLTSYGRVPLYEAYRALQMGPEFLAKESRETPGAAARKDQGKEIARWLAARETVTKEPPRRELDYFRRANSSSYGAFVNCTPGAIELATKVLGDLQANRSLQPKDVKVWVDAQDAVFEFCAYEPFGEMALTTARLFAPSVPEALPASEPKLLRQLRQYQIAAAHFYVMRYKEAQAEFEAIAQQKDHPLRAWAALANLRAMVRPASLSLEWQDTARKIYNAMPNAASEQARTAALTNAAKSYTDGLQAMLKSLEGKAELILKNPDLAEAHSGVRGLLRFALREFDPNRSYILLTNLLADLRRNPYADESLANWGLLGDRQLDRPPAKAVDVSVLRERWIFFDWIRTIQGCTDNPQSPNYLGRCEQEHEQALSNWKKTNDRTWLVAAVMTAPRVTSANEEAIAAALGSAPGETGYLTLQYHAIRAMRAAGRVDEARSFYDNIPVAEMGRQHSSLNLFRQQRVLMSRSVKEMLPYLKRRNRYNGAETMGPEGDELFNRRLPVADMVKLSQDNSLDQDVRTQLAVAAWLRADLLENFDVANDAARQVEKLVPALKNRTDPYLAARAPQDKHFGTYMALMSSIVSTQAYRYPTAMLGTQPRGRENLLMSWCAYRSELISKTQAIQRMQPLPALPYDQRRADDELSRLDEVGSAREWFFTQSFVHIKRGMVPPVPKLVNIIRNYTEHDDDCPLRDPEAIKRELQQIQVKSS